MLRTLIPFVLSQISLSFSYQGSPEEHETGDPSFILGGPIFTVLYCGTQVYFIEDQNLVSITIQQPKSQVDGNIEQIKRLFLLPCMHACMFN
jgi:hypothetical protein